MKKWLGGLLALVALVALFVVVVAATLPAATAYRYLEPKLQPLRLQGIDGNLWTGRATQVSVYALPLGELRWTLEPAAVLSIHARGQAALAGRDLNALTRFDVSREQVSLSEVDARIPASVLAPALDIPSLVLLGELNLKLTSLQLRSGLAAAAEGTLVWRNAGVSGAAEARFSDITVSFSSPRAGMIEGIVRDGGGTLAADGRILIEGKRFTAEIKLGVRGEDAQLAEALLYVGQRMPDGRSLLRVDGTLRRLF